MGDIRDRVSEVARRCGDLTPIAADVRETLWRGNREAVLKGLDYTGKPVAPLAPGTLKRRKGGGPPRAPRRDQSRVITAYEVHAQAGPGRLTFTGSWPGFTPIIDYLSLGTRRMPARPTIGFRTADLDHIRTRLRDYIVAPPPASRTWGQVVRGLWPFGAGARPRGAGNRA